jgi:hypothetical protein
MRLIVTLFIAACVALLSGCVVVPYGRPAGAYVVAPAPVVTVRPYYGYHYYYGPR